MKKKISLAALLLAICLSANAQMIGATNNQRTFRTTEGTSTLYRPTGPSLRLSAGTNIYGSIAYNYQITHNFMIGGGLGVTESLEADYIGISIHSYNYEASLPLFLEAEIRTPRYDWSVFFNLKAGLNIPLMNTLRNLFFVSTMVGVSYKNLSIGGGYSTMGNYNFENIVLSISYNLPLSVFF